VFKFANHNSGRSPPVDGISAVNVGYWGERLWKAFRATILSGTIDNSSVARIVPLSQTERATLVKHRFADYFSQSQAVRIVGIFGRNISRSNLIVQVRCAEFVLIAKSGQKVDVWQTSLLEFGDGNIGNDSAKDFFVH